jgi:hypothetical protein
MYIKFYYSAAKFTIFQVNSREITNFHTFSRNLFFTGMDGKQSYIGEKIKFIPNVAAISINGETISKICPNAA